MQKFTVKHAWLLFLFSLLSFHAIAQERIIKGLVTDNNSSPVPGANVEIKGTSKKTMTNPNGEFEISVSEKGNILVITYVGMETQEILIGDDLFYTIQLKEGIELEEVVVTAMGVKRTEKSLGYATTQVKGDEISGSNESNLINAISGKVAGVDISSAGGGVGSSSRILIRGVSNISSDNQPLFVVDGVPVNNSLRARGNVDYGNALSDINPNDIESLTVLKGASAAALYGSQAANGAVIITTKSGKSGMGFEFSSGISFDRPFRLPDYQNKYGPGFDKNNWNFWESGQEPYYAYGPLLDQGLMAVDWNSPLDANGEFVKVPLNSFKDNVKDFFETGVTLNNNFSFSKGEKDKYSFRLAYNNLTQKGMLYNTDLKRNNISLNASANIIPKLIVNTSVLYSNSFSGNRMSGNNYPENPVKSAFFMPRSCNVEDLKNWQQLLENGVPLPFDYNQKNEGVIAPGYNTATSDYYPNPYLLLEKLNNQFSNNRFLTIVGAKLNLTNEFTIEAKFSNEYIDEQIEVKADEGVRHWTGSVYSYKGYYSRNLTKRNNMTANAMVFYRKQFKAFNLNSFIGVERRNYIMDWESISAPELVIPGVFNMSNAKGTKESSNGYSESRINSVFGNIDLGFQYGFYLSVTGRNDWTSTLPESNRSYFYPSGSLSWVVSETFDLPKLFSFVKFRLSASQVGSGTAPYQLERSYYNLGRLDNIYEASVENSLKNPDLKPTRTKQYETGLDIRLFNARLNLDATYYTGKSFDQISWIITPPSAGYTYRAVNVGEVANNGVEISLAAIPVRTNDLEWVINLSYSKNNNKVISLAPGVDALPIGSGYSGIRTEARPGSAYGNMIGYGFKRDPEGNIIHRNGIPVVDNNQKVLGNITPDWLGNISTSLRYKNISLFVQANGRFGGDMFSLTTQWLREYGLAAETENQYRQGSIVGQGVMEEIQNGQTVYVPNNVSVLFQDYNFALNAYGLHEPVIFDASYVKLKEVRISYIFPNKWFGKLPVKNVNLSFVGRNLALLFSNIPHVDPEASASAAAYNQGFEQFNMPTARSFSFDLSFKF